MRVLLIGLLFSSFAVAKQKHESAIIRLAEMLKTGDSISQDKVRAASLYYSLAREGNILARIRLAKMLETGNGIPQDKEAAFSWYEIVGSTPSSTIIMGLQNNHHNMTDLAHYIAVQLHLAELFIEGDGVPQNEMLATYWYERAFIASNEFITNVKQQIESLDTDQLSSAEVTNYDHINSLLNTMYDNVDIPQKKSMAYWWYEQAVKIMELLQKQPQILYKPPYYKDWI